MRPTLWTPLALALALCGCRSTDEIGEMPDPVLEMLREGLPGGTLEMEVEDDGDIVGMEVDVPVESVPARVMNAAKSRLPNGLVTGAEHERIGRREAWEVKMWYQGTDYEFVITADGKLIESEETIDRYDCPEAVRAAADQAVPGGLTKSYEIVRRGGETLYHVKRLKDGASYKVSIAPDGRVLRTVREAKVEIEVGE
jgi:uncharacterized membrane protein YkoI